MKRLVIWLIFFFIFSTSSVQANTPLHFSAEHDKHANDPKVETNRFYKTTAKKGDGVYSLLRRYKLLDFPCNLERFYEINKLKKNANLSIGRTYLLPILIYEYNRRSIRSTIGIDNWDLAIRIQEFNREMQKLGVRQKGYIDNKVLWVPYHEMYCSEEAKSETSEKPESVKLRSFPIFGKKHQKVPLINKSLAGKIYYVVSGHGGIDPGAVGKVGRHQLCEDEYAYDVAIRLTREIVKRGGTAYLITRDPNDGIRDGKYLGFDKDETVWGNYKIPTSQKGRLFQRSDVVNKLVDKNLKRGLKDQRLIAIHVDSRSKSAQTDVFFYHYPNSKQGKRIANNIKNTFAKKYQKYQKNRGYRGTVTPRDLHMLRESKCTSVYVELGNISNKKDQQRFLLASNRQLLAEWLLEGFIK
jgi:N-acetylmuramoyl-L-alanine amidase